MGVNPRQTFQGHDDLLLLTRITQAPPWRHHGGVMDAWQQIAQALNADASCSLTTLTAAAARARFFRMVARRRAGQDKMLRRGTTDERQYAEKLQLLDGLIARMDTYDEETSLNKLLQEVEEDADAEASGHALPLPEPVSYVRVAPSVPVVQPYIPPPPPRPVPQVQQPSLPVVLRGQVSKTPIGVPMSKTKLHVVTPPLPGRSTPQRPAIPAAAPLVAVGNRLDTSRPRIPLDSAEPPAKKRNTNTTNKPPTPSGGEAWERVIDRALDFMQRKLQMDQEAAEADRVWRREEARTRRNDLKAMREQTDRLISAVLELARSK